MYGYQRLKDMREDADKKAARSNGAISYGIKNCNSKNEQFHFQAAFSVIR